MFDQEIWQAAVAKRLQPFVRNPRQELQLAGAPTILGYLVTQTITPFFEAFQSEPMQAVVALAPLTCETNANQLIRQAARRAYCTPGQVERELQRTREYRHMTEQLLHGLHTVDVVFAHLQGSWSEWFSTGLFRNLASFPGEFQQLQQILSTPASQGRASQLQQLRAKAGRFTLLDQRLLQESLHDSAAPIRLKAARLAGMSIDAPPITLLQALLETALHDRDAKTRHTAARSLGQLQNSFTAPQLIDMVAANLCAPDRFHRTAAALVLGQLGERAGSPVLIQNLAQLLEDDDAYAREAAARALGGIGLPAATPNVILALTRATQDSEVQVYEAASEALSTLKDIQSQEISLALSA